MDALLQLTAEPVDVEPELPGGKRETPLPFYRMTTAPYPTPRTSWAHRATATLLAAVQLMMVLASLTELPRGTDARLTSTLATRPLRESLAVAPVGGPAAPHNEATCPACIVRSLHARLEAVVPLPPSRLEQHEGPVSAPLSLPHRERTPTNFSRAPPIAG